MENTTTEELKVPSLLQISAERVAGVLKRYNKTVYQYLMNLQMPTVYINYLDFEMCYKTCDLPSYIEEKMIKLKKVTVVPTLPIERCFCLPCTFNRYRRQYPDSDVIKELDASWGASKNRKQPVNKETPKPRRQT